MLMMPATDVIVPRVRRVCPSAGPSTYAGTESGADRVIDADTSRRCGRSELAMRARNTNVFRPFRSAAAEALLDADLTDRALAELHAFADDLQQAHADPRLLETEDFTPLRDRGLTGALEHEAQHHADARSPTADAWHAWTSEAMADDRYALSRHLGLHSG